MVAVVHLTLAATWLGSMVYSLVVVQPRVARFFADDDRREEFLLELAHGNRWPVVALVSAIMATAALLVVQAPRATAGYAAALALYAGAAAVFCSVSWRHWPARVFALPHELAGFRRRLRIQAWTMLGLTGAAFVIAAAASTGARP